MYSFQLSSVTQSYPTCCDPMNHSTPGLPVHHQLAEFTQTYVHWVGDAIQPSHPLSSPSPPAPSPSEHQSLFQWVNSLHEVATVLKLQLQHHSFQRTPRADLLQNRLAGSPCSIVNPHTAQRTLGKIGDSWINTKFRTTEDEMAGWNHWLDGHESEWTPGVGDGQGGLACCDSWGRKESDTTERLNWTELNVSILVLCCDIDSSKREWQ